LELHRLGDRHPEHYHLEDLHLGDRRWVGRHLELHRLGDLHPEDRHLELPLVELSPVQKLEVVRE
jgi:hypothetical protein